MWSLPGWETEALAARAFCSMALCLRSAAYPPLRSSPTYFTPPGERWQRLGECQIINSWRCLTPSPTLPRNSSTSVPATSCRKSSISSWGSICRTSGCPSQQPSRGGRPLGLAPEKSANPPPLMSPLPHSGHVGKLCVGPLQPIGLHEGGKALPADANECLAIGR